MLDLRFIREHVEVVRKAIADKGERTDLDALLAADERRRELLQKVETLRHARNEASQKVNELKKSGKDTSAVIAHVRAMSQESKDLERELAEAEATVAQLLLTVPNVPAPDVPPGRTSAENVEVRRWGSPPRFEFQPRAHWDIGADLDVLDFERAAKVAGSNFALFKGAGARLVRALYSFMLDLHTREHGYTEVFPPFLVNRAAMTGTGQLPKLEEDMYHLDADDLFLIPTAEVPVTNLYRDELLSREDLPIRLTAYTACFRREAGSYGRETRGLLRVHQFDKVELVKFVRPETSREEHEKLLANAERVVQLLGLEYRVMLLSSLDMSFAAAKCYDIEIWASGLGRWLETSSCSNFLDFQARRANIRFRDTDGKVKFVHTLNGSGVALARLIAAILENYQNADGTVTVPEVLRAYMGGLERMTKP
jgi:seryl-tRNA synthetase